MSYDAAYIEHLREKTGVYDVMRPLRQHFHQQFSLLPSTFTLVDFAIGQVEYIDLWRRQFAEAYGYDINPAVAEHARQVGYEAVVAEQDVTKPFAPRWQADIAVCLYLFEHLTNVGVVTCVENMMVHAPLHLVKLTAGDDPRYREDETHCNAKSTSAWGAFLGKAYAMRGWKVWKSGPYATWSFATPKAYLTLMKAEYAAQAAIRKAWVT